MKKSASEDESIVIIEQTPDGPVRHEFKKGKITIVEKEDQKKKDIIVYEDSIDDSVEARREQEFNRQK